MGLATQLGAVEVGRVTAVYWDGDAALATGLAEFADRAAAWPGLAGAGPRRVRLVLAPDAARFDSVTGGRVPEWGAGAAFPGAGLVVLQRSRRLDELHRVLRHELAHLALHEAVGRVPRWFDEGYAARAAGEWDWQDALAVNWAVLRGVRPSLAELDRRLRASGPGDAEAAYAFAATAVQLLERLGGDAGLAPLVGRLASSTDFDAALRATYLVTEGQFEDLWHRDLRSRYGWLLLFGSISVFWALVGLLLVALWSRRHARDRERRAALDEGWVIDA